MRIRALHTTGQRIAWRLRSGDADEMYPPCDFRGFKWLGLHPRSGLRAVSPAARTGGAGSGIVPSRTFPSGTVLQLSPCSGDLFFVFFLEASWDFYR